MKFKLLIILFLIFGCGVKSKNISQDLNAKEKELKIKKGGWNFSSFWGHAVLHANMVQKEIQNENTLYFRKINGLLERYYEGERTIELYSAMMGLRVNKAQGDN